MLLHSCIQGGVPETHLACAGRTPPQKACVTLISPTASRTNSPRLRLSRCIPNLPPDLLTAVGRADVTREIMKGTASR